MHRRHSLTHLILAAVVALSLTPLMVAVDAGAQIAFASDRDGNYEIYVMDDDGGNLQNLTNHRANDSSPAWYTPPFAVSPARKSSTMWGWLKQVDQ